MIGKSTSMNTTRDFQPISKLKSRSDALLKRLEKTGDPIILTQNGRPKAVLQDAKAYQELIELRDRFETITGVRRGIKDMKTGRVQPMGKVFARLNKKHGLQG